MSKKGFESNYASGIRAENYVSSMYKISGWSVKQSPGSRGAADLKCTKGDKIHFVQVKSSSTGAKPYISSSEIGKLKSTATKNSATSVVATIHGGKAAIKYAKTGKSIKF